MKHQIRGKVSPITYIQFYTTFKLVEWCFWKDCRQSKFFFVNNRHNSWNCNLLSLYSIVNERWIHDFFWCLPDTSYQTKLTRHHWKYFYLEFHKLFGINHTLNLDLQCSHWYNEILVEKNDIECSTFLKTDMSLSQWHI